MAYVCGTPQQLTQSWTHIILEEGTAVLVKNRWEGFVVSRWSQTVVQGQRDGTEFVPKLIVLLQKNKVFFF